MPIYEYECRCGNKIELFLKNIDENGEIVCWKCNLPMKRIISTSFFKINGFNEKNGYSNIKGE
jgi:putative FmdB family regulatory protein